MRFDIEKQQYQREGIGKITILSLKGELKQEYLPILDSAFQDLQEEGAEKIILDFNELSSISSSGLGLLINLTQNSKIKDGIRLINVQKKIKGLLDLLGLGKRLKILENQEQAIASWS